ncbi:MAG: hypothetical protein K2L87_01745 [Clostridiales bacterium]|nr:hypothetical protein [Clostridiales bacterium]
MQSDKIRTYFGFAIRSGKLTTGVFAAGTLKKGVYLLAADKDVAPNSKKEIEKLQRRFACPLIYFEELGAFVQRGGCKLAAVRDESLAKAIIAAAEL